MSSMYDWIPARNDHGVQSIHCNELGSVFTPPSSDDPQLAALVRFFSMTA